MAVVANIDHFASGILNHLDHAVAGSAVHIHLPDGTDDTDGKYAEEDPYKCPRRPGRNLEDGHATRTKNANEFADIPGAEGRRHVLQNHVGIDQVKTFVADERQVRSRIHKITAAIALAVQTRGLLNHGRRNVHANDFIAIGRQGLSQSPDSAAEIESFGGPRRDSQAAQVFHNCAYLRDSQLKELFNRPPATLLIGTGQYGPERILLAQFIPVPLKVVDVHVS